MLYLTDFKKQLEKIKIFKHFYMVKNKIKNLIVMIF